MEQPEQTSTETPTLYNHSTRWGLIAGVASILLVIIAYVVDIGLMADWKFGIFTLLMYLGFAIYAGIQYRNEIGGYLAYGKAWQHGFILFAVCALVSTAFNMLLYTVIDPELPAKITEAAIEKTEAMLRGFGMDDTAIEQAIEQTRVRMADQYTVMGLAKSYLYVLIVSAVLALITSLFVRKNEPVEL